MFAARLNHSRQALSTRWWNSKNLFSTNLIRPARRSNVSAEERVSLRAARKERASRVLEQQQATKLGETTAGTKVATTSTTKAPNIIMSRYFWYLSVGVPSAVLIWGFSDENSPPAQFSRMIGLTDLVIRYTEDIAKPSHARLLPDWSQVWFRDFILMISTLTLVSDDVAFFLAHRFLMYHTIFLCPILSCWTWRIPW